MSRFLPINPSEVQTVQYGVFLNIFEAISRSVKLEWFISIRYGGFMSAYGRSGGSIVKLTFFRSPAEAVRMSARKNAFGFFGFTEEMGGSAETAGLGGVFGGKSHIFFEHPLTNVRIERTIRINR